MERKLHLGIAAALTTIATLAISAQSLSAQEHSEDAYGYVHESPNIHPKFGHWLQAVGFTTNGGMRWTAMNPKAPIPPIR